MGFFTFFNKIENYFLTRFVLLKLEAHEIVAKFVVFLISSFLFLSLGILILLFLGITFAILIGDYYGKPAYGFAFISLIYVLIFLILIIFRKRLIEKPIMDNTIKELNRIEKKDEKKKEKD